MGARLRFVERGVVEPFSIQDGGCESSQLRFTAAPKQNKGEALRIEHDTARVGSSDVDALYGDGRRHAHLPNIFPL